MCIANKFEIFCFNIFKYLRISGASDRKLFARDSVTISVDCRTIIFLGNYNSSNIDDSSGIGNFVFTRASDLLFHFRLCRNPRYEDEVIHSVRNQIHVPLRDSRGMDTPRRGRIYVSSGRCSTGDETPRCTS